MTEEKLSNENKPQPEDAPADAVTDAEAQSDLPSDLYDFDHPGRMTKEQVRGFRTIHENFSRSLGTYFTSLLRSIVDVQYQDFIQMPFLEFIEAQPDPDCVWIFDMENLDGKGLLETNPSFILLIIERLFGGEGRSSDKSRVVTSIEERVAERVVSKCLELYSNAWERVINVKTHLESFETDPRMAQIASAGESCLVSTWEVSGRGFKFPIKICLPVFALDPVMRKLSAQTWLAVAAKKKSIETRRHIESILEESDLPLRVYLGNSTVTMKELLRFKIGDVLVLDQKIRDLLCIDIGDKERLYGKAGVIGKNKAVRIVDWIEFEG